MDYGNVFLPYVLTSFWFSQYQLIYYEFRGLVGVKGIFNSFTRGTGFMHRAFQGMKLYFFLEVSCR
jgi:predicted membrane GTPase involved in stress response